MSIKPDMFDEDKNNVLGNSLGLGQDLKTKLDTPYAAPSNTKDQTADNLGSVKKKHAPNGDIPTTAAGDKGQKDLPSTAAKVDPSALGSVLPSMLMQFAMVSASIGGSSQGSRKVIIEDALSGALAILTNKYTYDQIIMAFDKALANNAIKYIDEQYRSIIKNALANLIKAVVEFGPNNVPVYSYSEVTIIGPVPSPLVTIVPDLYLQQYYIQADDPTPGYIKWLAQDNITYVYTERKIGDVYYESAKDEVYGISEQELAAGLDPYIRDNNLTAKVLNELMREQDANVETNTTEKSMGKNSSQNLMSLLTQLLGYAGAIVSTMQSQQLPQSVLNAGAVAASLQSYSKNIAMLKSNIKPKLKLAVQGRSPSSVLNAFTAGSIAGALGAQLASGISAGAVLGSLGSQLTTAATATAVNVVSSSPTLNATLNIARVIAS